MTDLLVKLEEPIQWISFNRVEKNNAFDEKILAQLHSILDEAEQNPKVRVIVLKAQGKHFSAGADLGWMERMASFTEEENRADAEILASLMFRLHQCRKTTIAMVQGAAYGGGAGLVAACDLAVAAESAQFCFSEVKLGLIPAVISPYVIKAIGPRAASALFMTAEVFKARRAQELQLVHHVVHDNNLESFTADLAKQIAGLAPLAVQAAKQLVAEVANEPIDAGLIKKTAALIAKIRVSKEGRRGIEAFLNKKPAIWE